MNNCTLRNINSTCINTEGSYDCECTGGFTGDLTSCLGLLDSIVEPVIMDTPYKVHDRKNLSIKDTL